MNVSSIAHDAVSLADLILKFGRVDRATMHPDGVRMESDTDHTVMLAVMAPALLSRWKSMGVLPPTKCLDMGMVVQFAIVHDLVEAECGDTCSIGISAAAADDKARRERVALDTITTRFNRFPWLVSTLHAYESQVSPEARFIKYLDKVLPKLTHILNGGAALRKLGYTVEQTRAAHDAQIRQLGARYPEFHLVGELLESVCILSEDAMRRAEPAQDGA